MIYRVCRDCGAMLPDHDEEAQKHSEWHGKLVDVLAAAITRPEELVQFLRHSERPT